MRKTKLNNYYLEMKEHYLTVPYYNEERRIRVLLPKDYDKEEWASYPVLTCTMVKIFSTVKSLFLAILGRLFLPLKTIKNFQKLSLLALITLRIIVSMNMLRG